MAEPIRINPNQPVSPNQGQASASKPVQSQPNFADSLAEAQGIKFSNHAQKRLQNRNIAINDDGLNRLANAVDKAEQRGGRESLILMDDMAFIVNVKEHLVVTALDSESRGQGVFTQIDSVVFADPKDTATTDMTTGNNNLDNKENQQ
jgi:flagellar operon protein